MKTAILIVLVIVFGCIFTICVMIWPWYTVAVFFGSKVIMAAITSISREIAKSKKGTK